MKYYVDGYLTMCVCAEVEASSPEEARKIAMELAEPSLCHQCAGEAEDGCWGVNEFDPPADDCVVDVRPAE